MIFDYMKLQGWYLLDVSPMFVDLGYKHCESYYSLFDHLFLFGGFPWGNL
jgi:hypothetical protein